jgi:hypothetical protein
VFAYGERFTRTNAISFGCIWTALAIFSLSSLREFKVRKASSTLNAESRVSIAPLPE